MMAENVMEDEDMPDQRRRWYVDKSIPLPTILLLALQTIAFAFWLGGLSRDVQDQGKRLNDVVARANDLNKMDVHLAELRLRLAYIEAETARVSERVSSIERARGVK
jgi:hypothetical protein